MDIRTKQRAVVEALEGVKGRDIVVHVMHPAVRSHYNLEELWGGKEVRQKPRAKTRAKAKPAAKKQKRPRAKTARPRRRK